MKENEINTNTIDEDTNRPVELHFNQPDSDRMEEDGQRSSDGWMMRMDRIRNGK